MNFSTGISQKFLRLRLQPAWTSLLLVLITSCALAQPYYPDFTTVDSLALVGTAQHIGNRVRLTSATDHEAGAIWYKDPVNLGAGFITRFSFQISGQGGQGDAFGQPGGDGVAFVIQNVGPDQLGGTGGYMGYGGIRSSLAIEFDTYANDDPKIDDYNGNRVSVQTRGQLPNHPGKLYSIGSNPYIPNLSDGEVHTVIIGYVGGSITIYIDDCSLPVLAVNVDLANTLFLPNGKAWVGLTSATGAAFEAHEITSWIFNGRLQQETDIGLCAGDSVTLTVPGHFASQLWSNGSRAPSIRVGGTTAYVVSVVDTIGCVPAINNYLFDISTSRKPTPKLAQRDTIYSCQGTAVELQAIGGYRWLWSNGKDTTSNITITAPGRYWVQGTDLNGCVGFSDTVTVLFRPLPSPTVSVKGKLTFCKGDSVTLEAPTGYRTYRWSNGDTTQQLTTDTSGAFTVTVVDSSGCTGKSKLMVVQSLPIPTPAITFLGASSLCAGASTMLDAGAAYASYLWSNGDTTRATLITKPGSYWVRVANEGGCTAVSRTVNVSVHAPPTPAITLEGPASLCAGDSTDIVVTEKFARYIWSTGDTTPRIRVGATGDYSLSVIDSNGCSGSSSSMHVDVHPLPHVLIRAAGPLSFCEGGNVRLEAPNGFAQYLWTTGSNSTGITVSRAGRYGLRVLDSNGCAASDSIEVMINSPAVADASGDTTMCPGGSAPLHAMGGVFYSWSPSDGLSCADCAAPIASPLQTTTYRVTVTNTGGCIASDSVTVAINNSALTSVSMGPSLRVAAGQAIEVPLFLDSAVDGANVSQIDFGITYQAQVMKLVGLNTSGSLLSGWQIDTLQNSNGRFRGHARNAGASLSGKGRLLSFRFLTFLGDTASSSVVPEASLPNQPCAGVFATGTTVTLDSICGLNERLITSTGGSWTLAQNVPNPFQRSTVIHFSLALDGPVSLAIYDANGTPKTNLVTGTLSAGTYEVAWDASGVASGLYYYRIQSGDWVQTRVMEIIH